MSRTSINACIGACLLGCLAAAARAESRPNILFIFTDDHGPQAISAYGSYRNQTPNLDRLAAEGMRFDNCLCTNSICAPSRAVILTGLHNHLNGNTTNERLFDNRQRTFPPLLQRAGYQTALIGKWHLRTEPIGFDYWDKLINQGTYYNPWMIRNGQRLRRTGYTTDIITDLALEWLQQQRDPQRPFMLMVQHKAPHREWDPGPDHLALYDGAEMPEPPTLFDDWANRSSAWSHAEMSIERHLNLADLHLRTPTWQLNPQQVAAWEAAYEPKNAAFRAARLSGQALTKWKYQRYAKDYLRCIASVDDNVGRLLRYLDESGLAESTVVLYSSDQGWFLGEHGWFDKRWMYEESLRMPLLVRWPGVTPPGAVCAALTQNLDFASTFLDIAGAPIPADLQGSSLVPLLKGGTPPDWRKAAYYHFYEDLGAHRVPRHYGVRTERYKLIHFYKLDEWELFDLARDPDELVSVYDDPAYADVRRELAAELERQRAALQVTDAADREYDDFDASLRGRWDFLGLLGHMPPRGNIDVQTLGVDDFETHRRERIAYTIGDQRIEAYVLLPRKRDGLAPAVVAIHPSGAYESGKRGLVEAGAGPQAAYAVELCERGYVVLCADRFGYESRRLAPAGAGDDADRIAAAACRMIEQGGALLGQELTELWFAHDYLTMRPEAQALRVGVMGCGDEAGLLAALLACVNEDVWAAVSCEGARLLAASDAGPGTPPGVGAGAFGARCGLLTIPGIRRWGDLDKALAGIYPRPLLELRGGADVDQALAQARRRYAERDCSARMFSAGLNGAANELTPEMRRAAFEWLDRWLRWKDRLPDAAE